MLAPGQLVAGRYLLESLIGEGAMGAVYRAEDKTLRRQVAIKFLFVGGTRDPQGMVDQFLREARIAASIQHRNVIQTVDFGTVDQFQPFMVMELLNGESLGDRMAREPKLTNEQFVHLISLTLRGLAAVHDAGIVHRDLKPQNIFLQRDADAVYPKILDFGISRSLAHAGDRPSAIATQQGLIVGTPDYMSPEQARGEADIDRRSDIYSMGVIMFEGLAGRLPFEATTVGDLIVQIITTEPPRLRDLDPTMHRAMSDLVAQAMAKDREHRFADARALRRAVLAVAEAAQAPGRRPPASVPPAPMPPSPVPVAKPAAPLPGVAAGYPRVSAPDGGQSTWGDFEGLRGAALVDRSPSPGPSIPAPTSPQQQRLVAQAAAPPPSVPEDAADSADQAPTGHATPADRASGQRSARKPGRPTPGGPPTDGAAALDPLYAGADQAAPDLDYERIERASAARRPKAAPSATRSQAREARRAARMAPPSIPYWRNFGQYALPLVAAAMIAYVMLRPPLQAADVAPTGHQGSRIANATADKGLGNVRLPASARRRNPGAAPPHMRDVVF